MILKSIAMMFTASVILFSCSESLPIKNNIISKDDLPTVAIENLKTSYTEEGKMKAKLQAALLQQYDGIVEPYFDFPKGISIVLYNKDNKIETSLTANKAIYYQTKKSWEATGNVVISNINGDVLQTEKLYGDEVQKKIFTDQLVKVTKADGSFIKGVKGFESNTEFTIYKFLDGNGRLFYTDDIVGGSEDSMDVKDNSPVIPKRSDFSKTK